MKPSISNDIGPTRNHIGLKSRECYQDTVSICNNSETEAIKQVCKRKLAEMQRSIRTATYSFEILDKRLKQAA